MLIQDIWRWLNSRRSSSDSDVDSVSTEETIIGLEDTPVTERVERDEEAGMPTRADQMPIHPHSRYNRMTAMRELERMALREYVLDACTYDIPTCDIESVLGITNTVSVPDWLFNSSTYSGLDGANTEHEGGSTSRGKKETEETKEEKYARIKETLKRKAMWQPRLTAEGKVDLALHQLLVRTAQNALMKVDPDSKMEMSDVVRGMIENVWQDVELELTLQRTRTHDFVRKLPRHREAAICKPLPRKYHPMRWLPEKWADEIRFVRKRVFAYA
jgi:hypothetical protein